MNPHAAISREDERSINMLMIFSFMCTSANAKVRSDKSYNLLGKKKQKGEESKSSQWGGAASKNQKERNGPHSGVHSLFYILINA